LSYEVKKRFQNLLSHSTCTTYTAAARNTVLPALLDAARAGGGGAGGFYGGGGGGFMRGPAGVTMDAVAAVAEAHFGYEQLAEVCEAAAAEAEGMGGVGGSAGAAVFAAVARLHHYMRTLRGAPADKEGTFATFMFHRMMTHAGYSGGVGQRIAKMLQNTPDEFYDELSESLRPHPPLLWLHQLRADDYAGAASTLHGLSSTGNGGGGGGFGGAQQTGGATLSERRQYLSLAKLSLLAAGVPSNADDIISIDAALNLTSIQIGLSHRKHMSGGGAADPSEAKPLPPLRLVEACLEGSGGGGGGVNEEEDLLDSFAVFASSGGAFRETNKSLLEKCWRRAASATDWEMLGELRGAGSDAAYVRALQSTTVARAARRCYDASFAVRRGPPFDQVLTPRAVLDLLEEALGCGGEGEGGGEGGATDASTIRDPVREALGLFVSVHPSSQGGGEDDDEMA
jgi:nuclear pore complex protein Nup133